MAAMVAIPAEVLRTLPKKWQERVLGVGQPQRFTPLPVDVTDCVKALLTGQKLPLDPPAGNAPTALAWRRAFVAATAECHQRKVMGQMPAMKAEAEGLLVPARKGMIEPRVRARRR
jgi:hypothetical protein